MVLKVDASSKNQMPVAHVITTRAAAGINACYAAALATTPTVAGKVVMQLAFSATGTITSASDTSSTLKGTLLTCISTALLTTPTNSPLPDSGKQGAKATVTLQLAPATTGPGYGATIDPAWIAKTAPRHKRP